MMTADLSTLTFIDLETTGLDETIGAIIEFGAVRLEGHEITETFSAYVDPGCAIPAEITRLTGIRNEDVAGCPGVETVMADFLAFVGKTPSVAHNAVFETKWIKQNNGKLAHRILDSLTLARVALPHLAHHDLESLIRHYKIALHVKHRATSDAEQTARLWLCLIEELEKMHPSVLEEMNWLFASGTDPLKPVFSDLEARFGTSGKVAYSALFDTFKMPDTNWDKHDEAQDEDAKPEDKTSAPKKITQKDITGVLGPGGALSELPSYEDRPQQRDMAEAVSQAFANSENLLAEAGTGVGKSLAYLVPSVFWAMRRSARIVISTNTKNLQAQLYHKDLPLLKERMDVDFKTALLKGRRNYLCLWKLFELLRESRTELGKKERNGLLSIIPWAVATTSGDIAEHAAIQRADQASLLEKLTIQASECTGRACEKFNQCFLFKARAKAQEADIIVTNHSVVLTDLVQENPTLPAYEYVVFDEAHNLEQSATDSMGMAYAKWRTLRILNALHTGKAGLLRTATKGLTAYTAKAGEKDSLGQTLNQHLSNSIEAVTTARASADVFEQLVQDLHPSKAKGNPVKIRLVSSVRAGETYQAILRGKEDLVAALGDLGRYLKRFLTGIEEAQHPVFPRKAELTRKITSRVDLINEVITELEFLTSCKETNYVYWVELVMKRRVRVELCAAPVDVSKYLRENLFLAKKSVILTSATLRLDGDFAYIRSRIGVDDDQKPLRELPLGTSFDYNSQAKVLIPTFLPEPTQPRFTLELARFLREWMAFTKGRGLLLFTSYQLMNNVYAGLAKNLDNMGIRVLCQGIHGGRDQLLRRFREEKNSVLLGTASFWEGIDVLGESLTFVGITRLPFPVFTEPIHEARSEQMKRQGKDSFLCYSLPSAMIRFKQGFGRLIRSRMDRGVVVVTDKRIATRYYGRKFLKDLPCPYTACADMKDFFHQIKAFIGEEET